MTQHEATTTSDGKGPRDGTNERIAWALLGLVALLLVAQFAVPGFVPQVGVVAAILAAITTLILAHDGEPR